MAKAKSPPKKLPSKSTAPTQSPMASLEQRVKKLETQFKSASLTAPVGAPTAGTAPTITATADSRPLSFSLGPNAPAFVKLTLDQTETLILGTDPVSCKPKPKGVLISLLIDLHGNAGQTATITITNATNTTMTATIPAGRSDWSESRALLPSW